MDDKDKEEDNAREEKMAYFRKKVSHTPTFLTMLCTHIAI